MAQANVIQQVNYRLVMDLSPNELVMLQAIMQNPLRADEPEEEAQLRRAIFNACAKHRT